MSFALLACLSGCQRTPPKRVQIELAPLSLSSAPVKALLWAWDEQNTKSVAKEGIKFTVEPADLASASPDGQIACQRSGDGEVHADLLGVTSKAPLRCRLVDHIEAPSSLGRIELANGAIALNVGVFAKDGQPLSDVPLSFDTKNLSVVRKEGDKLMPLAVGDAKINVRAGEVSKEFSLQVVRQLKPEALPLNDNRRINFSLEEGKYELNVTLQSPKQLEAEWRGAPYCNYKATGIEHKSVCVLRTKGGVAFDNPAYLDSGSKEVSHAGVTLFEVP